MVSFIVEAMPELSILPLPITAVTMGRDEARHHLGAEP
jgi:hypothetical protein